MLIYHVHDDEYEKRFSPGNLSGEIPSGEKKGSCLGTVFIFLECLYYPHT